MHHGRAHVRLMQTVTAAWHGEGGIPPSHLSLFRWYTVQCWTNDIFSRGHWMSPWLSLLCLTHINIKKWPVCEQKQKKGVLKWIWIFGILWLNEVKEGFAFIESSKIAKMNRNVHLIYICFCLFLWCCRSILILTCKHPGWSFTPWKASKV